MIHYKQTNPSSTNNISSGYALNDSWINIVTYTKYEQTSDGVWAWREYSDNIVYPRLNQQAGSVIVSDAFSGDGTLNNPISPKPKLDFLFVDDWDFSSSFTPTSIGQSQIIDYHAEGLWTLTIVDDLGLGDGLQLYRVAGEGTDPFVPISQTTIFIHPTTFQRYMFNGTTMVEYDDVDGVVPKWLKYVGKTWRTGEVITIEALNKDELDFFKINWAYIGSWNANSVEYFDNRLTHVIGSQNILGNAAYLNINYDENFEPSKSGQLSLYSNENWISDISFEVKKRIRGNPPKLVIAETNVVGDKVILTFDKELSLSQNGTYALTIGIIAQSIGNVMLHYCTVSGKRITTSSLLSSDLSKIIPSDTVSVYFNIDSECESLDYGLLQPFTNFPVTNNVPAPPELLAAYLYTGEDGLPCIRLDWVKSMNLSNMQYLEISIDDVPITAEVSDVLYGDSHNVIIKYTPFLVVSNYITISHPLGSPEIKGIDDSITPNFIDLITYQG